MSPPANSDLKKRASTRSFFSTPCWKKTALGGAIALSSSEPLAQLQAQKPLVIIGGVHGDEPEGIELATRTLEWLQTEQTRGTKLRPWIVIPCLNVDGAAKNERVNGRGVDLNRNYPSHDWEPTSAKPRYSPGPGPASEPEVQAIVELIAQVNPVALIHCHSWEPCIVCTGAPGLVFAEPLSTISGYELRDDIGYSTPGSLSAYGWHDKHIPVICIEERDGLRNLAPIWPRFAPAMRAIFEVKT